VLVKVFISETGDVEDVEVLRGDPILAGAAVNAAKKWKYKPFIRGGKPIKVNTKISFDFAFSGKVTDTALPTTAPTDNSKDTTIVRISQGVSQGLLIHRVQPIYPRSARQYHVQGAVILRAVISKDGRIEDLTPISGPKELIPAAVAAVQQWRYKPYLLEGQPVEVETQIVVRFQLSGG
jgi:TonB family protein